MEIVHIAEFDSPIGALRIASTEKGLAYVELPHASGRGLEGWLRRRVPEAQRSEAFAPNRSAVAQILEYLEAKRTEFELPLEVGGAGLHLEGVWLPVVRRPALDDVAHVHFVSLESHGRDHLVEELASRSHEGLALFVLVSTGTLADEADATFTGSPGEHRLLSAFV